MQENIFNRKLLHQNWERFHLRFNDYNFLYNEVANRIDENLAIFNKKFEKTLKIQQNQFFFGENLVKADDEFLPFKKESFDLIVSNLNFHFINQIPQFLLQVKSMLKPGGVFIASFLGEENLPELRKVLYEVENELYGGVSPKMAPTIDVKTAANLLQKAGFSNPTSTFEEIKVEYSDPINLLKDLKMMSQGNIIEKRSRKFMTKNFLDKISKKYKELYQVNKDKVLASFEVIMIIGTK